MTSQPTKTTESTGEPLSMLRPNMLKEGAQRQVSEGRVGPASTTGVPERSAGVIRCCHHWVIELAVGPLSKAECRRCGAERIFRNHFRWAEIAPVRAVIGQRQADAGSFVSETRGAGRRAFDSGRTERIEENFGYAVAERG